MKMHSVGNLFLIVFIISGILINSSQSFIMYAIHDVSRLFQSSSSSDINPSKPFNPGTIKADDEDGKLLLRLIESGQKLTNEAHQKLSPIVKQKPKSSQGATNSAPKPNKYRNIVVEELDYLEMLLKRAESYLNYLNNPFMKKLINYTKQDLQSMVNYFEIILQLYDQGDDLSIPILTNLLQQLLAQTDLDVGYLNSNGYREYANKISDQRNRLQLMLRDLKQKMEQLDSKEFSQLIKKMLSSMIDFENLVLEAEKHSNINSVHH